MNIDQVKELVLRKMGENALSKINYVCEEDTETGVTLHIGHAFTSGDVYSDVLMHNLSPETAEGVCIILEQLIPEIHFYIM